MPNPTPRWQREKAKSAGRRTKGREAVIWIVGILVGMSAVIVIADLL